MGIDRVRFSAARQKKKTGEYFLVFFFCRENRTGRGRETGVSRGGIIQTEGFESGASDNEASSECSRQPDKKVLIDIVHTMYILSAL